MALPGGVSSVPVRKGGAPPGPSRLARPCDGRSARQAATPVGCIPDPWHRQGSALHVKTSELRKLEPEPSTADTS